MAQALQALERATEEARARAAQPPPFERRHTVRVQCRQELVCRFRDRHVRATALDVSLGGMRLRFEEAVSDDRELELLRHEDDSQGIRARLAWLAPDGRLGGVHFLVESAGHLRGWLLDVLHGLIGDPRGLVNRRRYFRVVADLPARLATPAGEVAGRLLDLGLGGALWEAREAQPPGTEILLAFTSPTGEELRLPGRVLHAMEDGLTAQHRIAFGDLGEGVTAVKDCVMSLLRRSPSSEA